MKWLQPEVEKPPATRARLTRPISYHNDYGDERQLLPIKLRFKVDQGEALRQGIDAPTSVVTIEIDPQTLNQEQRNLLADRMEGIDVRELHVWPSAKTEIWRGAHITAKLATFEALMEAVSKNEEEIQAKGRSLANKKDLQVPQKRTSPPRKRNNHGRGAE